MTELLLFFKEVEETEFSENERLFRVRHLDHGAKSVVR
jgi:hypothetical protein